MTHAEYKEMLAQHALVALDESEARALEDHLAGCASCRTELAGWRDTVSALAYSAPLVEPSAALRSRLLESIRAVKAEAPVRTTKTHQDATRDVAQPAGETTRPNTANVIPMPDRTRTSWTGLQKFGALAASLAFAAFAITLWTLWTRNRSMQEEMARLSRDLQTTEERLNREQEISRMMTAPDTRVADLGGTEMAPGARALLAYNKAGEAMMIASALPPAPAGMDYQLWYVSDGKPVPGGVFKPDASGHARMRDQMPAAARAATSFVITLEPQGGTILPTGQKYLLSTVSS